MNSLAITLCVLMEVIIAKTDRLPADTLNSNKVRAFSVPLIPASESLDSPQPSSTPIYNTDTDIQTQKNDHLNHVNTEQALEARGSYTDTKGIVIPSYNYNTDIGIQVQEYGHLNNVGTKQEALEVRGSYNYTDNDGNTFQISYIANENGFQPKGTHLPTVPPLIKKALQYSAEENGKE
ncbi:larval cuticle protein lcp-17 [Lasius niger]|uniref:Larval cuticle protein lcp-17 n=1 Tax=Lasius niger TaxID=67767 RepID=A0A0J7L978_LASNI|nr:larval cuticle protein lcp-17 [Lasius niger]